MERLKDLPEREPGCICCEELLEQQEGLVAETEFWRVIVSRDQGYLGRSMIIAKHHVASEADISEDAVIDFHYLKIDLEQAAANAFGARICNWTELGNDAFAEEDPKPHLHHHMRPRYDQAVSFAGVVFDDPNWGSMYDVTQRWNVDKDPEGEGFKDKVARALREELVQ